MKRPSTEDSSSDRNRRVWVTNEEIDANDNGRTSRSPSLATTPGYKTPQTRTTTRRFVGSSKISDYQLIDKLGEGTFGEVYKARHAVDGKLVALKKIILDKTEDSKRAMDDGIPITAIREMKILKGLHHMNIVPMIDVAVERPDRSRNERGKIYMVLPYMDHDLAGLLDNPSVILSIPQIKTYTMQLLEGTAYLHHNHILHRDIKAANLLINNEGTLQIADFGLARVMEEGREEYTTTVVTRWYRPPELLLNSDEVLLNPRSHIKYTSAIDMWGVGCIFAEMFYKRPILQGRSDMDQLELIFKLCGSPNEANMPNWRSLLSSRDLNKIAGSTTQGTMHNRHRVMNVNDLDFGQKPRRIKERFHNLDKQAVDLIDRLLVLDPSKRLTAVDALRHDYFYSEPKPADPSELPTYEPSHEYDRRHPGNKDGKGPIKK